MYKLCIQSDTDGDFRIDIDLSTKSDFTLFKEEHKYEWTFLIYEENIIYAKLEIISILSKIKISSVRQYLIDNFNDKMINYIKEIRETKLKSSMEFFGGNQEFSIHIYRIEEEYL